MKKILFVAAAAVLAAVSCDKGLNNDTPAVNNAPDSFVATVDGAADTKTVLTNVPSAGTNAVLMWQGVEEICVFGNEHKHKIYKTDDIATPASTATFNAVDDAALESADYLSNISSFFCQLELWRKQMGECFV